MRAFANGITLEFETFGLPSDQPLLLISGLNTPMTRWTPEFCEQLASSGFYVIRFDNRDCGLSTHFDHIRPANSLSLLLCRVFGYRIYPPYTLTDMVDDAVALLDSLQLKSAHIVGRSMGGMIAQILAGRHPERVKSLTVIMSGTGNRALPLPSMRVLKHLLKRKPNPQTDLAGYLKSRVEYTHAIGSRRYPLDDFYIRSRVIDDLKRSGFHPGAARRQLSALLDAGDLRPLIRKITVPTLVIHGEEDEMVPCECGVDVHRNIPNSRLKIIKDMGHSLQPEFYDELINEIAGRPGNRSTRNF